MHEDTAETIAITALSWLAMDSELLTRFLRLTGIAPEHIRAAADEPAFLAGVLTFFMQDERLLARLAEETSVRVEDMAKAHQTLAGPGAYDQSI